ncbi:MAG: recombinase family protein [Candidatus Aenigmatarchaeota archaeon]
MNNIKIMNKNQIKNCAIYTRVSTDNQVEKEFSSCLAQEEKIKAFVKSQEEWKVFKVYSDEGYSGANLNRPALQELLKDIQEKKIDIVLVYKIDRLTRSPKDFYQLIELFEKNNVSFISITERFDTSTPAGRLLRNIMLTFAQFERELASERTKDKMIERAKRGMWNGGTVPYGYSKENKKLILNQKEAEIVKLIYEIYITTGSLSKVYEELKIRGIRNRENKIFTKSHLENILRNIVYTEKVKYSGQIYQGIHQPIISEEIFNLAQQIHKKKIRKLRVYKDFLFGGFIMCEECQSKMTPCFTNKRKEGKLKRYYYYRCTSTLKRDWQACTTREVSAVRLESYILENLERISLDKNYIENLVFRLNYSSSMPDRLGYELTESCSKFEPEIIDLILKSTISILKLKTPLERNLLLKNFLKQIVYSKENIKITLFYSENLPEKNSPARQLAGGASALCEDKENSIPPKNNEFVSQSMAPEVGLEPTT